MGGTEAKAVDDFLISKDTTVGDIINCIRIKNQESKEKLINAIYHRFYGRYLVPLNSIPGGSDLEPDLKSGFLIMATACLMIEAMESFYQGRPTTKGKSKEIFENFFKREENIFPIFRDIKFYENIRCGILHQAETTEGWRIIRDGMLVNINNKTINATIFLEKLTESLNNYKTELETSDWDAKIWKNAIKKLEAICDNCK